MSRARFILALLALAIVALVCSCTDDGTTGTTYCDTGPRRALLPSETATLDAAICRARDGLRPFALDAIRSAGTAEELANVTRKLGTVLVDADLAAVIAERFIKVLDTDAGARPRAADAPVTQAASHP
jgi:hypothetical protein